MRNLFLITIVVLGLSSCSKNYTPYSSYLPERNNWSESEIERIQFYTSEDIVLYRQISDSETEIINGKIKMENGREVDEVIIKEGTPGVAVWIAEDKRYGISFDDSDELFLTFGPNPERKKRYYLMAGKWQGKTGVVTYQGQEYKTSAKSASAYLMVDLKSIKKVDRNSHVAKGRTID